MNPSTLEKLKAIGQLLLTQGNRCTESPMFCVQVRRRLTCAGDRGDGVMYYDTRGNGDSITLYHGDEGYAELSALDDDGELPENVECLAYQDIWETVAVCFTEAGCQEHLRQNGHNYQHFEGTRIYAESFFRNPEMNTIRDALMELAKEECAVTP